MRKSTSVCTRYDSNDIDRMIRNSKLTSAMRRPVDLSLVDNAIEPSGGSWSTDKIRSLARGSNALKIQLRKLQ